MHIYFHFNYGAYVGTDGTVALYWETPGINLWRVRCVQAFISFSEPSGSKQGSYHLLLLATSRALWVFHKSQWTACWLLCFCLIETVMERRFVSPKKKTDTTGSELVVPEENLSQGLLKYLKQPPRLYVNHAVLHAKRAQTHSPLKSA